MCRLAVRALDAPGAKAVKMFNVWHGKRFLGEIDGDDADDALDTARHLASDEGESFTRRLRVTRRAALSALPARTDPKPETP